MTNTKLLRAGMLGILAFAVAGVSRAQSPQDNTFLRTATQIDYNEVQFSMLAVQRSSNPEIKAFANRVISDFTELEQTMSPIEKHNGIASAASMDAEHKAKFDHLNQLSGQEFDKEYIRIMDADDHAALTVYQDEEHFTMNPDFHELVSDGDKVVADETTRADALDRKLGMTPAGKPVPSK